MAKWNRKIVGVPEILDGYNETADIPAITKKMIVLLKEDKAYLQDSELVSVVEDFEIFEGEEDAPYFDLIMNALYDWADRVHIWIEPLPEKSRT